MRSRFIHTCLVCLCFLLYSSALPRSKDYRPKNPEYVPGEGSSSVGTDTEPSCEELRAMWRFSKRQSRAAEITNEIPTYRDPFAYNVWEEYARPRSAGSGARIRKPPIYGRIIHTAPTYRAPESTPERFRVFEEVTKYFGTPSHPVSTPRRKTSFRLGGGGGGTPFTHLSVPPPNVGSFQHLKELIRTERARELQEQRLSEESERSGGLKGASMGPYGHIINRGPGDTSSIQLHDKTAHLNRGMMTFPDVKPAKYYDDYVFTSQYANRYKPRLPDFSSDLDLSE